MSVSFALLAVANASDVDPIPWWVGRPVASVQITAPDHGELPNESLQPLLRVAEGQPLDPHALAQDLSTLFQVGGFEAVEGGVEEWVTTDPQTGNPIPSAIVTYTVYPAPRLARIRVHGSRGVRDQQLIDASGLQRGQLFFAELDGPFVEDQLRAWLATKGYAAPRVQVRTTQPTLGEIYLVLDVDAGTPLTLDSLKFAGAGIGTEIAERRLRRWAAKAGVKEGEPLAPDALGEAQNTIRENLGRLRGGPFETKRAWTGARVSWLRPDVTHVTYTVELGPDLRLDVQGLGRGGTRLVADTLGVDHRLRLTRGFVDQAPDRLKAVLQEHGWLEAKVTVAHEDTDPAHERLVVRAERGPRHTLGDVPPDFVVSYTDVEGREAAGEQTALQALFDQASPDVLRRDFYTEEAMARGITAAEQWYLGQGYLDVQIALKPPTIERRASPANVVRQLVGQPRTVTVTPRVEITRGPRTTLAALEVTGAPSELDLGFLDEEIGQRVGAPYSPQGTDALARRIVEVARANGYLGADTRVQTATGNAEHTVRVLIAVEPGEQILLRSIVVRGARHTKPDFVTNQLGLVRGAPLSSVDLERVRSQLYDLGTFDTVSLDLVGDEQARDLVIRLDEAARYRFEVPFGISTDQGMRAAGQFTRLNLFGRAQSLDLFAQLGFRYRSSDVQDWLPSFAAPEWRGAVKYTAPRFPLPSQRFEVDVVLLERRQERTWSMDRTGGGLAIESYRGHTTLRLGTRVETRTLGLVDADSLIDGEPWDVLRNDPSRASLSRWQESMSALVLHDRPSSDALFQFTAEWVPGLDWSRIAPDQPRTAYLKGEARFSFFVPLSRLQLHLAGGAGAIMSMGGIVPLEDRFRLGGAGSLRGFVRDAVGPHNIAASSSVQFPDVIAPVIDYARRDEIERWTPTGGDATASLTTELLIPFPSLGLTAWEGYAAEVFADVGNVWMLDRRAVIDSELPAYRGQVWPLRVGFGAGVRFSTPIGPLQFDVALNPEVLFANRNVPNLLVDGWREPWGRLHLTLGALF